MSDNNVLPKMLGNNYAGWDTFIRVAEERLSHLTYFKVLIPAGLFEKIPLSLQWYAEGFRDYIMGMPNSSVFMLFKCMEMAIKEKYRDVENKNPNLSNSELINWAEKFLKENTEIAQGFRILRNILQHENNSVKEQQSIDALRYVSEILNLLYPYEKTMFKFRCQNCAKDNAAPLKKSDNFLGNNFSAVCQNCRSQMQFKNII